MVAGLHGLSGLSVHQNVTLESKLESDSAIHPPHSMGAPAVLVHTFRLETATPTPAQVLHNEWNCGCHWDNKDGCYFTQYVNECSCVCTLRCVSTGYGVHVDSGVWGSWRCMSTCVFGHDCLRGTVCHHLLRWLLLRPRLLPVQWKLCAAGTVSMLPPRRAASSGCHPACWCLQ